MINTKPFSYLDPKNSHGNISKLNTKKNFQLNHYIQSYVSLNSNETIQKLSHFIQTIKEN